MLNRFVLSLLIFGAHSIWSDVQELEQTPSLHAEKGGELRRLSEAFGHLVARDLKNQEVNLNVEDVVRGLKACLSGKPSPMEEKEYMEMVKRLKDRNFQEMAAHNLALANAFMASNAKKAGIIELIPNKVQYRILKPGKGAAVAVDSSPSLYYVGRYLDGTLFGGSEERQEPVVLSMAQMIPGFRGGVVGMREGEQRRLFIHPDLAYGMISEIPPNSLLIFEVEVVKVNAALVERPPAPVQEESSDWDFALEDEDFSSQPLQMSPY